MDNFIDPDLLGLRKKEWNTSVSIPGNALNEETHERKLIKVNFKKKIKKFKTKNIDKTRIIRSTLTKIQRTKI